MENTARLFNCARCRRQVIICSHCDRGNIYCGKRCSEPARKHSLRSAGFRYQHTHRGRLKHADRQRRYRSRCNKVTHQGSPATSPSDSLSPQAEASAVAVVDEKVRCHFCGRLCSDFLRLDFIHRASPILASDWKNRRWLPQSQGQAP